MLSPNQGFFANKQLTDIRLVINYSSTIAVLPTRTFSCSDEMEFAARPSRRKKTNVVFNCISFSFKDKVNKKSGTICTREYMELKFKIQNVRCTSFSRVGQFCRVKMTSLPNLALSFELTKANQKMASSVIMGFPHGIFPLAIRLVLAHGRRVS